MLTTYFTKGWIEQNDVSFALCVIIMTFVVWIKVSTDLYLLRSRASSYTGKLFLKNFSSDNSEDKHWLIDFGICFMMLGGWFDVASTYIGSLFSLRYG